MSWHSLGYQGRNCFVLFLTWLTQMVRHLPWTVSSNLLLIFIFLTWKSLAPHEFVCREGLQAAMQMTLKQSKPATNLSSANYICSCNVTFSLLHEGLIWPDIWPAILTKLPFLCSVFSFRGDCLISLLHRSLQGQRAKGSCRKDGGEKSHTSMWTEHRLQPFSLVGSESCQLTWQKAKVDAVELYINHWLPGEELE